MQKMHQDASRKGTHLTADRHLRAVYTLFACPGITAHRAYRGPVVRQMRREDKGRDGSVERGCRGWHCV